jgi:FkbM family methyltransferase
MKVVLEVVNGWAIFPASLKLPTGAPRFHIEFPAELVEDRGARHLIIHDSQQGYELPTRNLIEKVLRPGDVFIDVGAHWGFFTLQAVTHPAGNVQAIAFEADPGNASVLYRNIVANGLTEVAHAVCAACGDRFDIAPLISNSSMGHSIHGVGLNQRFVHGPPKWVSVVTLDTALAYFPQAADSRLILKVDVEGYEPKVIAGARGLLASGRVALIIWECGGGLAEGAERTAMIEMLAVLSRQGFRHFRPPGQEIDGEFLPFNVDDRYFGNVFSLATGLKP